MLFTCIFQEASYSSDLVKIQVYLLLKHVCSCSAFGSGPTENGPLSHAKCWGDFSAQTKNVLGVNFSCFCCETDQEADVNVVSQGQICYQLVQLIVFL